MRGLQPARIALRDIFRPLCSKIRLRIHLCYMALLPAPPAQQGRTLTAAKLRLALCVQPESFPPQWRPTLLLLVWTVRQDRTPHKRVLHIVCSVRLERSPLALPQHVQIVPQEHMGATPQGNANHVPQVLIPPAWVPRRVQRVYSVLRAQHLVLSELPHLQRVPLVLQDAIRGPAHPNAHHAHWDRLQPVLALVHALFVQLASSLMLNAQRVQTVPEELTHTRARRNVPRALLERTRPTRAAPARPTALVVLLEHGGPNRLLTALLPAYCALRARTLQLSGPQP